MYNLEDTCNVATSSEALVPEIRAISQQHSLSHEEESCAAGTSGLTDVGSQSRLEALIQEQNELLLRQIQLVEGNCKSASTPVHPYKYPRDYLKMLDPCVRSIFANWRKDFRKKVDLYVAQSELSAKYQVMTTKGELMKPFIDEAHRPWDWTQFYRSVAEPIDGSDHILPGAAAIGLAHGNGGLREKSFSSEQTGVYDIDTAFAEMRQSHAWEHQKFVVAHQKACFDKITEAISMPKQVRILQGRLFKEWAEEHRGFCHEKSREDLEAQAKHFVELVYQEEMPKADSKIKEEKMPSSVSITMVRGACMFAVSLAVTTLSHELLTRLFSILFALSCGMALLWEDLVRCCLQVVLGESVRRLRLLGEIPDRVRSQVLTRVNIPMVIWQ